MAHLQNWFGLLPPDIVIILPWSESLDKPLKLTWDSYASACCYLDLAIAPSYIVAKPQ